MCEKAALNLKFIADSLGNNDGDVQDVEEKAQQRYAEREAHAVFVLVSQDKRSKKVAPISIGQCGYGLTVFSSVQDIKSAFKGESLKGGSAYLVLKFCGKSGTLKGVYDAGGDVPNGEWKDVTSSISIDVEAMLKARRDTPLSDDAASCTHMIR